MKSSRNNSTIASRRNSTIVFILLFTSLLPVLYQNAFSPSAPVRNFQSNDWPLLVEQRRYTAIDRLFQSASENHNLQLHFQDHFSGNFQSGLRDAVMLYRAVYTLYPNQVFVGQSSKPINFPADLYVADVLPANDWMRSRNIRTILTVTHNRSPFVLQSVR